MGRIDHKKRLYLMGRAKEVVVTASGENIYLDDVEHTLGDLSHIKEYVLVGIPDNRGGERLGMLAVLDDESKLSKTDLEHEAKDSIKKAINKLPSFQRPAVIHTIDADLPRTRTRKVQRKESKAILERIISASADATPKGNASDVSSAIIKAVSAVTGSNKNTIHSGTNLRDDLGFDSLMAVELASVLANIGTGSTDADALAKCETIGDIVTLVGLQDDSVDEDKGSDKKVIPEPLAQPLKAGLALAQHSFYGQMMNTQVIGSANIPKNRQVIVVSNHCSHLDMGLVKFALGRYGRKLTALAAKDYFFEGNPWVVAYFEQLTNLEPIDRQRGYRASLRQAIDIVEQGNIVLLFPEGTRRTDGVISEFKPLVGQLALETDIDILPLYLQGTFESMPKGAILPTNRDITVHIGAPIQMRDVKPAVQDLRISQAARITAKLAQHAIESLRDGSTFNLHDENVDEWVTRLRAVPTDEISPIQSIMQDLKIRYDSERVKNPVTWYFSLDGKEGPRYTVSITNQDIKISEGRINGAADCVVKTSVEILRKLVKEGYTPQPAEFMSGNIKTSNIPLLLEFQRAFNLTEPLK